MNRNPHAHGSVCIVLIALFGSVASGCEAEEDDLEVGLDEDDEPRICNACDPGGGGGEEDDGGDGGGGGGGNPPPLLPPATGQIDQFGWRWTSDGYTPATCGSTDVVNYIRCTGSYCDNMHTACGPQYRTNWGWGWPPVPWGPIPVTYGGSYWTDYFSEENYGYGACLPGYVVTGLSCYGSHCDNLSLQCTQLIGMTLGQCRYTRWYSEEGPSVDVEDPSWPIVAMWCDGDYCDDFMLMKCEAFEG